MKKQGEHAVLPVPNHDEAAIQDFLCSLKVYLQKDIQPGNREVYDDVVVPAFQRLHERLPNDRQEIRCEMERQPFFQMYSSLQRTQHSMTHYEVGESIYRQLGGLIKKSKKLSGNRKKQGSLRLDPSIKPPRYLSAVDIHFTPGSYYADVTEDDITAGARYDRGFYIYMMGGIGPYNDDMGAATVAWLEKEYSDFQPRKILEMGCTAGNSLIPYVDAYPEAVVCGIDVGAPVLRYGHARAESLQKSIHFSQQDAEHTDFEDSSFDLIVSHILLHETSRKAVYNIMAECHRLLAPGGMVLHAEAPIRNNELAPFDQFIRDWSTHYNNEPFWGTLHDMDLFDPAEKAGFRRDDVVQVYIPMVRGEGLMPGGQWFVYGAVKS
ncbi:MAG: class I SAM-dependent methyltransferase [Nitrospinota bacterium]